MLELAIWLYHIGTPDLAVRIASKEAHYWKMVANHRRDMLDKTRENLYKWHGSRKS